MRMCIFSCNLYAELSEHYAVPHNTLVSARVEQHIIAPAHAIRILLGHVPGNIIQLAMNPHREVIISRTVHNSRVEPHRHDHREPVAAPLHKHLIHIIGRVKPREKILDLLLPAQLKPFFPNGMILIRIALVTSSCASTTRSVMTFTSLRLNGLPCLSDWL